MKNFLSLDNLSIPNETTSLNALNSFITASSEMNGHQITNILQDDKSIWLSEEKLPQQILLNFRYIQLKEYPKRISAIGIYCWNTFPTNPKVIEIFISDSKEGEDFISLGNFTLSFKGGKQLLYFDFDEDNYINDDGINLDDLLNNICYDDLVIKILIKETFGGKNTYINNIYLYENTETDIGLNNNINFYIDEGVKEKADNEVNEINDNDGIIEVENENDLDENIERGENVHENEEDSVNNENNKNINNMVINEEAKNMIDKKFSSEGDKDNKTNIDNIVNNKDLNNINKDKNNNNDNNENQSESNNLSANQVIGSDIDVEEELSIGEEEGKIINNNNNKGENNNQLEEDLTTSRQVQEQLNLKNENESPNIENNTQNQKLNVNDLNEDNLINDNENILNFNFEEVPLAMAENKNIKGKINSNDMINNNNIITNNNGNNDIYLEDNVNSNINLSPLNSNNLNNINNNNNKNLNNKTEKTVKENQQQKRNFNGNLKDVNQLLKIKQFKNEFENYRDTQDSIMNNYNTRINVLESQIMELRQNMKKMNGTINTIIESQYSHNQSYNEYFLKECQNLINETIVDFLSNLGKYSGFPQKGFLSPLRNNNNINNLLYGNGYFSNSVGNGFYQGGFGINQNNNNNDLQTPIAMNDFYRSTNDNYNYNENYNGNYNNSYGNNEMNNINDINNTTDGKDNKINLNNGNIIDINENNKSPVINNNGVVGYNLNNMNSNTDNNKNLNNMSPLSNKNINSIGSIGTVNNVNKRLNFINTGDFEEDNENQLIHNKINSNIINNNNSNINNNNNNNIYIDDHFPYEEHIYQTQRYSNQQFNQNNPSKHIPNNFNNNSNSNNSNNNFIGRNITSSNNNNIKNNQNINFNKNGPYRKARSIKRINTDMNKNNDNNHNNIKNNVPLRGNSTNNFNNNNKNKIISNNNNIKGKIANINNTLEMINKDISSDDEGISDEEIISTKINEELLQPSLEKFESFMRSQSFYQKDKNANITNIKNEKEFAPFLSQGNKGNNNKIINLKSGKSNNNSIATNKTTKDSVKVKENDKEKNNVKEKEAKKLLVDKMKKNVNNLPYNKRYFSSYNDKNNKSSSKNGSKNNSKNNSKSNSKNNSKSKDIDKNKEKDKENK